MLHSTHDHSLMDYEGVFIVECNERCSLCIQKYHCKLHINLRCCAITSPLGSKVYVTVHLEMLCVRKLSVKLWFEGKRKSSIGAVRNRNNNNLVW